MRINNLYIKLNEFFFFELIQDEPVAAQPQPNARKGRPESQMRRSIRRGDLVLARVEPRGGEQPRGDVRPDFV